MTLNNNPPTSIEPMEDLSGQKSVYVRPVLLNYGDLRSLTLGGSPGTGESAAGGIKKRKNP